MKTICPECKIDIRVYRREAMGHKANADRYKNLLRSCYTGLELLEIEVKHDPEMAKLLPGLAWVMEEVREAIK